MIPYPRGDEIQPAVVLRAAIRNYFFPILAGALVLEVNDQGALTSLNAQSLRPITKQLEWSGSGVSVPELLALFDMATWALELPAEKHLKLAPQAKGAPSWGDSYFRELDIEKLRQSFENGERMGFVVPVKVERKKQEPKTAWFKAYVCKDLSLKTGEDHYIRQGITVTKIRQLKESSVRGLVVVDDKELSALLGDAEEPAHTDWLERAAKLKQGFEHGPSCVRFVKQTLRQLVEQLSRPPQGMKDELLKDVFFIDRPLQPGGEGEDKEGEDEGNKPPRPPPEPPPPMPPNLMLQRIDGGCKITGQPGLRGDALVEFAYAVRRGNAFKKYDPNDFDLGKGGIDVECEGAQVVVAEHNTLLLTIERDGFEVRVLGFDANRDLRVRGNLISSAQEASAAEAEKVVA